jgi:undecaprenyl-diphosphatase
MNPIHVIILALVQGLTELLPVSSSAHVIVTAALLHENMSTPANALLLVLLHTGTMFAVIAYFWRRWREEFFASWDRFWRFFRLLFSSCLLSGIVAVPIILVVGRILGTPGHPAQIEVLFSKLNWIAPALAAAGLLILWAGLREARRPEAQPAQPWHPEKIGRVHAAVMGILQGLAIPFRGFSRSGATISGGLLGSGERSAMESFSFAMAVAITPLAIAREVWRLHKAATAAHAGFSGGLSTGALGMVFAFLAGLLALRWLSSWLEAGRWYWFGIYCLVAAATTQWIYMHGALGLH